VFLTHCILRTAHLDQLVQQAHKDLLDLLELMELMVSTV
jgi:hypothetical protein